MKIKCPEGGTVGCNAEFPDSEALFSHRFRDHSEASNAGYLTELIFKIHETLEKVKTEGDYESGIIESTLLSLLENEK